MRPARSIVVAFALSLAVVWLFLAAGCSPPRTPLPPAPTTPETVTPPPETSTLVPGAEPTLPHSREETRITPPPVQEPAVLGTVVIDAGHQARGNSDPEPIGPGASKTKAKVSTGTRGVATGNLESEITLQVALRLEQELRQRGVEVVQVRREQDVDISNAERSAVANDANADLFVRLHADGGDSSLRGISTLIPGSNRWTSTIVEDSAVAGRLVHRAVLAATDAEDRGVRERTDLTGFNWSEVPTVLVEMGFMTNAEEDRRLGSRRYQQRLAEGMADGIVEYLESK